MKIIFLKKNYNMNKSIFFIIFIMLSTNVFGSEAYFDLSEKDIKLETISNNEFIIKGNMINKIDILIKKIDKEDD